MDRHVIGLTELLVRSFGAHDMHMKKRNTEDEKSTKMGNHKIIRK